MEGFCRSSDRFRRCCDGSIRGLYIAVARFSETYHMTITTMLSLAREWKSLASKLLFKIATSNITTTLPKLTESPKGCR